MTNKLIAPRDLMPADSLCDIFNSDALRYKYSSFQLIHTEVHQNILKCLAFDKVSNEPSYLEIDTLALNSWNSLIFSRVLPVEDFNLVSSAKNWNLDYYSLFEDVDFKSENLNDNQRLKFHLFGEKSKENSVECYTKMVRSIDQVTYNYPDYQIKRVVSTYNTYRLGQVITTTIKLISK